MEKGTSQAGLTKRASDVITANSEQISTFTKYAGVASGAYCVSYMPTWSCSQCRKSVSDGKIVKTFRTPMTDTNGFVMTSAADKTIYLVFRGSISAQNWMTDFQAMPVPYSAASGASVHSGFQSAIKDSVGTYFPIVKAQLDANPDYKILVTGHSLGGALALLGGMDLTQRDSRINSSNLSIFTYGGPRVGNKAFAEYVVKSKVPVFRSVNKMDPIPQTPPTLSGYVHPGVESWKKLTGSVQICNTQLESPQCSVSTAAAANNMMDHLQ
ncbi:lipase precursor [Blakeslea trispora]|nr:lipase precursor [Blakeslea trispora]